MLGLSENEGWLYIALPIFLALAVLLWKKLPDNI